MNMLAQAQGVCGTTAGQDEDMVDYINVLRESVLEAYSGIVQVSGTAGFFVFLQAFIRCRIVPGCIAELIHPWTPAKM